MKLITVKTLPYECTKITNLISDFSSSANVDISALHDALDKHDYDLLTYSLKQLEMWYEENAEALIRIYSADYNKTTLERHGRSKKRLSEILRIVGEEEFKNEFMSYASPSKKETALVRKKKL